MGDWKKRRLFKKGFPERSGFRRRKRGQKEGEDPTGGKMWDVGKITEMRKMNAGGQPVTLAGNATPCGEGKLRPGECSAGGERACECMYEISK